MEAFTAGTEGIEGKYKDMVIGFKKDAEGMQTHASTAVEDMRKSVQGNFDLLNKEYGKGKGPVTLNLTLQYVWTSNGCLHLLVSVSMEIPTLCFLV
jgi:hypothetical protein